MDAKPELLNYQQFAADSGRLSYCIRTGTRLPEGKELLVFRTNVLEISNSETELTVIRVTAEIRVTATIDSYLGSSNFGREKWRLTIRMLSVLVFGSVIHGSAMRKWISIILCLS
jgi:hypothetical protein